MLSETRAVVGLLAWHLWEHLGSCCKMLVPFLLCMIILQCSASYAIFLMSMGSPKVGFLYNDFSSETSGKVSC